MLPNDVHVVKVKVKITFFDFFIEFFIRKKGEEWFKILNERNRNDNVAVLHTTSPSEFRR